MKNGTIDIVTFTNQHVIDRAGLLLRGAFGILENFCKIFVRNIGEEQEKSCHLRAVPKAKSASGALALCHMLNPHRVFTLRS